MNAEWGAGHCFYRAYDRRHCSSGSEWEGMHGAREQGSRIGMLLDLD